LPSTSSAGTTPSLSAFPRAVDVGQEQVEGADTLAHAGLDDGPIAGGDDARDDVEREDAVDRVALAVDRERDPLVVELGLGSAGAVRELVEPERVEPRADQLAGRAVPHAVPELAETAARIVAGEPTCASGSGALHLDLHRPDFHAPPCIPGCNAPLDATPVPCSTRIGAPGLPA
jgi:hypothetical protein